ncbi:hypothetical protein E2C01_008677 [Portunus trituberculatus]|uniref:Uncharacterized protein n=1 Tax=Portunus trituberculatus TaxID=210409 RepID=A0A5B7D4I3_PORTR|nr:hypothetical protein [Portunus trituberculatus]
MHRAGVARRGARPGLPRLLGDWRGKSHGTLLKAPHYCGMDLNTGKTVIAASKAGCVRRPGEGGGQDERCVNECKCIAEGEIIVFLEKMLQIKCSVY